MNEEVEQILKTKFSRNEIERITDFMDPPNIKQLFLDYYGEENEEIDKTYERFRCSNTMLSHSNRFLGGKRKIILKEEAYKFHPNGDHYMGLMELCKLNKYYVVFDYWTNGYFKSVWDVGDSIDDFCSSYKVIHEKDFNWRLYISGKKPNSFFRTNKDLSGIIQFFKNFFPDKEIGRKNFLESINFNYDIDMKYFQID